jgi:hypothetical protein
MSSPYPEWSHFPKNEVPPFWVNSFLEAVAGQEPFISTVREGVERGDALPSDLVLRAIGPGLEEIGYVTETSKKKPDRIIRPQLYGHNGELTASLELDAFHEELGIAVEVEAGQSKANNNDYRDIVRTALLLDVKYLVLVVPQKYRSGRSTERTDKCYERARNLVESIYASSRLKLPFEGVLVVGY